MSLKGVAGWGLGRDLKPMWSIPSILENLLYWGKCRFAKRSFVYDCLPNGCFAYYVSWPNVRPPKP